MFCRRWLIWTFVAVAMVTGYSGEDSNTGSDSEVTVHQSRFDNIESSTADPVQGAGPGTAADLGALLDDGEGAVVALVAGDTRLLAHRAVLAARSAVLQRALLDSSVREVAIPEVEGAALRQLVAYLYTLRAPRLPGTAAQLLAAADLYGLPALKADCEQQAIAQLSVETAAAAAVLAIRHNCGSLRRAAVAYIRAHILQVVASQGWADAIRNQPEDMIQVMQLLSEPPAETSSPAPTDSGTSPLPGTQPHGDHSRRSDRQTPATAAPTTAAQTTAQADDDHVSLLWSLPPEEKGRRLRQAAKQGAVEELEALLAAGADVGAQDEGTGWTALHWAAYKGQQEMARRLLASAAAVGARDHWQRTPLHMAALQGDNAVVRLLMAAGADHSARDDRGNTPLHVAARKAHTAVVRLLMAAGADPSARTAGGWTPLHWAAMEGHREAAAALLEAGADRAARDRSGDTALDVARWSNQQQVVALLQGR